MSLIQKKILGGNIKQSYLLLMVDTLKSAASFFKSKWAKDELTQTLTSAMNDDDSQPSTTTLHQIANASYSIDEWAKIWQFAQERINSGKAIRINKALTILEFLMKNGNEAIVRDYKGEIRMLTDLQNFSGNKQSELRVTSIRRKAKAIVELLNNPKRLQEERKQADAIKSKLGTTYANKTIVRNGENNSSKPQLTTKSSYDGMGSTYHSLTISEKEESSFTKVTGMATSLVKELANKLTRKQDGLLTDNMDKYRNYTDVVYSNNPETRPQMTPTQKKQPSKLFDKLNVRKPAGITKTHSNNVTPAAKVVRSEIKSEPSIPAPEINFFEQQSDDRAIKRDHQPSKNIDLFDFDSANESKTNNTSSSNDIFSFQGLNSMDINSNKHQIKSGQSSNFDIFALSFETSAHPTANTAIIQAKPDSTQNKEVFADLFF